jgi:glycosidase
MSEEKTLNFEKVGEYVGDNWKDSIIPSLSKYIEIENQSPDYDSNWETNGLLDEAINHMKKWVEEQKVEGITIEVVKEKGKTPLIFLEIKATFEDAPTCLLVILFLIIIVWTL